MSDTRGEDALVGHRTSTRLARVTAVGLLAGTALLGSSISAHADGSTPSASASPSATASDGSDDTSGVINTDPPASPTETDLSDAPTDSAGTAADPSIPGIDCTPGTGHACANLGCDAGSWFTPKALDGKYHSGVGATQSNYNGTKNYADEQFTASASGTVGVSFSGTNTVSVNAMLAKVDVTWGVTLSASLTATLGNSITIHNVAPKETVHASYGVWRRKFTGTAYRQNAGCKLFSSAVTGYGPYEVGWYTWSS